MKVCGLKGFVACKFPLGWVRAAGKDMNVPVYKTKASSW